MTAVVDPPSSSGWRAALRGWGPLGILAFVLVAAGVAVTVPIGAVIVLIWAWLSRTPFRDLGFVRPGSWLTGLVIGIVCGVGLKFLMKAVVLPLLGAPPVNQAFHYLAGNLPATIEFALYALVGAGIGEEIVFRGYLFERFGKIFGTGAIGSGAALVLITLIFGSLHWSQGLYGIVNATVVGGLLGLGYLFNKRRLWSVMVAHAAFDLTAAAMIYYDAEPAVAHAIFR